MSTSPLSTRWPNSPVNTSRRRPRRSTQLDLPLLVVVLMLMVGGLLTVLSASAPVAQLEQHNSLFFFQRQSFYAVLGLFVLAFGATVNLNVVRRFAKYGLLITGCLLIAVHIPHLGVTELGASRWVRLGPISIQPSEVAKLALAIYGADLLARYGDDGWNLDQFRQALLPIVGVLGLVLFQPDLGSTIVLAIAAFVLFFCNGTRLWQIALIAGGGVFGVIAHSLSTPYQRVRWESFMNPWADPQGNGFQLVQSLMAVGSGGVFGLGWGQGKQKLFWLPIQYADFIFAVLAEELGLVGCVTVLALFTLLAWRGFAIAREARDPFQSLLVIALTTVTVAQALINIGVVTASLPTTGIPLPFLSFGGTSLLMTLFSMGLVLNVSRQTQRQLLLVAKEAA